jgi:hypothetical protein
MSEDFYLNRRDKSEFVKKHSAAIVGQVVEAAPASSSTRFVIDDIWCDGSANGTLQILDSDDVAVDGYFFTYAANSGFVLEDKFLKKLPQGKGFKYTQTGGGNYAVGIKYHSQQT